MIPKAREDQSGRKRQIEFRMPEIFLRGSFIMSLFRKPKFQRFGPSWESILDFFAPRSRQTPKGGHKNRRLTIDPLEERMLLTVSIGNTTDQSVNQLLGSQTTGSTPDPRISYTGVTGTQAVASDANGDFVVAWTGYDPLIDPITGLQEIDSLTGLPKTEANIYARYFTDEVQRITLPASMLNSGAKLPAFSLTYGGNAVQEISFSQTYPAGTATTGPAQGVFSLAYDLNGDGSIDPVTETTKPIQFDETQYNSTDPTLNPATLMQNALQSLGGPLADVTVSAVDSHDYLINFGNAFAGLAGSENRSCQSGFWANNYEFHYKLDATDYRVCQHRQPAHAGRHRFHRRPHIYVSPTNAALTAQSIQSAFTAANWTSSGITPVTVQVTPVGVTAQDPTGLLSFDVTFVGNSGNTDQPQLMFSQMTDASGNSIPLDNLNVSNFKILKQNSPEFRVNPPEPQNPFSSTPTQYNQTDPAVAMDADGDFVITWTGVVPDSVDPGSQTDVFAARYSPAAYQHAGNGHFQPQSGGHGRRKRHLERPARQPAFVEPNYQHLKGIGRRRRFNG